MSDHSEAAELLIRHGAEIDISEELSNLSPIHYAIRSGLTSPHRWALIMRYIPL